MFVHVYQYWIILNVISLVFFKNLVDINRFSIKGKTYNHFSVFELGCKIKALRAKTNTYIKTPVRGEEPVFVVTGRKEDVNKAKREILSAADHFSLIRASRKPSMDGSTAISNGTLINPASLAGIVARTQSGPPCLPGQITNQVRVPYRVVGLVVGPKGATIKHIQQETQTYIVTPSREKEPIFEVTGLPDNVETARKQIEAHIALRTGNSGQGSENGNESIGSWEFVHKLHTINTLTQILNDNIKSKVLSPFYKNDNVNDNILHSLSYIISTSYFRSTELINMKSIVIFPIKLNRQSTKGRENSEANVGITRCNVNAYTNSLTKNTFQTKSDSNIMNTNTSTNWTD